MFTSMSFWKWIGFSPFHRRPIGIKLKAEVLEDRSLPAILFPSFFVGPSIDGSNHNSAHPEWGSTNSDFIRKAPAGYGDGKSNPSGDTRANPRLISNALSAAPEGNVVNNRDLSAFVYIWGQFIDHDLDLTDTAQVKTAFNFSVPKGDPYFDPNGTGTQVIFLNRSNYDPATGTSPGNPRQQVNSTSAWLDGSMVYGSDNSTALKLRTLSGGKMKTGDGMQLPVDASGQPFAGDTRATENPGLLSLQVLFLREHNRLADLISTKNPGLSDEVIYQKARLMVIGEIQAITYNEFLPALLGSASPAPYSGYKSQVNPGISNEFATAAYRLGHSMVTSDEELLDNNGNQIAPPVALRDAFFDFSLVTKNGIEPFLKYLASDRSNEIDLKVVDDLRNFLFGPPGAGGFDLAALNIQRGRDHGLADYNSTRAAFGLPKVNSFSQITSNPDLKNSLETLYGNVNNIDLWVGGLAEDHLKGSSVGPTFAKIISDQFQRLRDGDRFWYQNVFSGPDRGQLDHLHLTDIIRQNTTLTNLQDNVFLFKASVSGTVFADTNHDGVRNRPERGLGGRKVELMDDSGAVIALTLTGPDGFYRFDHLDLGRYTIREVLPPGTKSTQDPIRISITKGNEFTQVHLGETVNSPLVPSMNPGPARGQSLPHTLVDPILMDLLLDPRGRKPN